MTGIFKKFKQGIEVVTESNKFTSLHTVRGNMREDHPDSELGIFIKSKAGVWDYRFSAIKHSSKGNGHSFYHIKLEDYGHEDGDVAHWSTAYDFPGTYTFSEAIDILENLNRLEMENEEATAMRKKYTASTFRHVSGDKILQELLNPRPEFALTLF